MVKYIITIFLLFTLFMVYAYAGTIYDDTSFDDYNLTEVGNITGTDVDVSAGTGDITTSGIIQGGTLTDSTFTTTGGETSTTNMTANITVDSVGAATYQYLQDFIDTLFSAGRISGGGITDDTDGTITVASGTGMIKVSDSNLANTVFCDWVASTTLSLVNASSNHIYVAYDGGTPTLHTTTNESLITGHDEFEVGHVYRDGTTLHITQHGTNLEDHLFHISERAHDTGHVRTPPGIILGETGTRNITVSSGTIWAELTKLTIASIDTSSVDTITYHYNVSGTYDTDTGYTQIDNFYYDNGTDLTELTTNRYGVHWVYIHEDGDVHIVFGQGNYKLTQSQGATPPATLPDIISQGTLLIGKIVIQKSASSFTETSSAFDTPLGFTTATDHADISNLAWTSSNHTGTASTFAGFDGSGDATEYNVVILPTSTVVNGLNASIRQLNEANQTYRIDLDRWADEFADESGIDTDASTDELYDATDDYYGLASGYTSEEEFLTTANSTGENALGNAIVYVDKVAMSFQISESRDDIKQIQVYIAKTGTPGDITVTIEGDSPGHADGTPITNLTGTILESAVGSAAWVACTFSSAGSLTLNTTYWLVFTLGGDPGGGEIYSVSGDGSNNYANGHYEYHPSGGSWTDDTIVIDMAFKIQYFSAAESATLYSFSRTATTAPDDVAVVTWCAFCDGTQTISVSRDNGSTYTGVSMTKITNETDIIESHYGTADISGQPAGTTMILKAIITAGAIYGWGVDYSDAL